MKPPQIANELSFHAEEVFAHQEEYTPDDVVHGIYFGEGAPEQGGQHWGFYRSFGDDDDGVCTVKEIQEVTVYGGLSDCLLMRQNFTCHFDDTTASKTRTFRIHITFEINEETWQVLKTQAKLIFSGEDYFRLQE